MVFRYGEAIEKMIRRMMQLFNGLTGELRDEVTVQGQLRRWNGLFLLLFLFLV